MSSLLMKRTSTFPYMSAINHFNLWYVTFWIMVKQKRIAVKNRPFAECKLKWCFVLQVAHLRKHHLGIRQDVWNCIAYFLGNYLGTLVNLIWLKNFSEPAKTALRLPFLTSLSLILGLFQHAVNIAMNTSMCHEDMRNLWSSILCQCKFGASTHSLKQALLILPPLLHT